MSLRLYVVGLGPGGADQITQEARDALSQATDLLGYGLYVRRAAALGAASGAIAHATDNREELARARHALDLAMQGRVPVVVSGGDAGVFGMASAVFEAVGEGPEIWRAIDIRVVPGVTAVLAAAARLGAPLGGDFCVISLSDNLKPWEIVARRLRLAAEAGLVIALYNPRSQTRPGQLDQGFAALREVLPGGIPVVFARAIGRPAEQVLSTTLAQARGEDADMSTLVLIGCAHTRQIERPGQIPWLYTLRRIP
ncbi:precorrin-3B C(17)-methyltransferase [Asaia sp. BMEF1]|uniref:precorrin-3B C(17)-methyltransferase n=1 Tax=Asaia sp. BMEF1 TaxID=3155932 RepID=UPI003F677061